VSPRRHRVGVVAADSGIRVPDVLSLPPGYPIDGVACGLPLHPGMISMGSNSAAQVRELLPLIERRDSVAIADASVALASRAAGLRRRRGKPRRFGLLRLAPRLVVLTGNARHPNWPAVAAGIGSAFTGSVDPDDAPWCA
jgi:hypothetical protein